MTLTTDGDRLLQVVTNLLANALQRTPDAGRIELRLARQRSAVTIAVQDSGPGITAELAQALGGTLTLESEGGNGTRFVLTLHAVEPERRRRRREPVSVA